MYKSKKHQSSRIACLFLEAARIKEILFVKEDDVMTRIYSASTNQNLNNNNNNMNYKLKYLLLIVFSLLTFPTFAQTGNIKGVVFLEDGKPAEMINIFVVGTTLGSTSNSLGEYQVNNVPAGSQKIIFSFIGYNRDTIEVNVIANTTIDVPRVIMSATTLIEVEVTAKREKHYVETLPSQSLRITTPLIETPQNISVATQQTLKDFGINGTGEMGRLTSGITKRYGNDNDIAFIIRGTDATNNIFRNGVGSYWWNQQSDAFMIDRVEFVKGPAGFMIGNSEPGGLLNEVTKQADGFKTREFMIGYGSFNLMRAGIDLGGKFSDKSKFSYRAVIGGQYTNAFYDFYKAYRYYAVGSLRHTYKPESFVQAEINYMDGLFKAENYNNITYNGNDFIFPETFNATDPNALNGMQTSDNYIRISHQHKFKNGWSLKTQGADVRGKWMGDGMYVAGSTANFDTLYRQIWYNEWRNGVTTAQIFLDGKFKTTEKVEHTILTGFDYGHTRIKSAYAEAGDATWGTNNPLVVSNPVYNLNKDWIKDTTQYQPYVTNTKWLAWYGQDHIKFFNKFILTLAGRYSYTESYLNLDSTTVYDTKFTPRLGLTYLITKKMSMYALYDESFLPQTGRMAEGQVPKPLTGTNIEFGYKAELLNNRLAINSSYFNTVKNNVLVQNPLTQLYEERGQITSKGFEIAVIGNVTKNIMLNVNYTYTDAKITRDVDSSMIGFPNYGVAKHTANGMIRYKFTEKKLKGLSLGAGVQYTDDVSVVWAGWTDPADKYKTLPSYAMWDANVSYEREKFTFQVNVFNLTNKRVLSSGWWNSNSDPTQAFYSGSMTVPTNFRLAVNYKL
jgi:iron complex outermembrane receptor protein